MTKVLTKKYFDDGRPPESIFVDSAYTVSHAQQVETGLVKRADNYVPAMVRQAHQPVDTTAIQRVADSAMQSTNPSASSGATDSLALASLATNIETSRPIERAIGTAIRMLSVAVGVFTVAWTVGKVSGSDALMFGALGALVVVAGVWVVRNDNRHSPAGIEHGKIDGYVDIRRAEIESQERVAMRKIDAFMGTVGRVYGERHDDNRE